MEVRSNPTFKEALTWASLFMGAKQVEAVDASILMLRLFDWNLTQLVAHLPVRMSKQEWVFFEEGIHRFCQDEPLAYILGYQDFMGRRFKVTRDTLIPREETAGLLSLLATCLPSSGAGRLLDLGTGSGIIAVMAKRTYPNLSVTATDISPAALAVARENGDRHGVSIEWRESDLFAGLPKGHPFDIVISNPPYIGKNELSLMDISVLKYEPKQALFAPRQGLAFYERMAQDAGDYLDAQGHLLVEIGFSQGSSVLALFHAAFPKARIQVYQDFNGLDRYVQVDL